MTMVSSGLIALAGTGTSGGLNQSVEVELGGNGSTLITMNDSNVRTLAGVASGAISLSNFYGKSNRRTLSYTFSSNTANASLSLSSISGYVAGVSDITVTINSGIYLYSTSTGTAGLTITGGTSGDTLKIVNNGYIAGCGGNGGSWSSNSYLAGNNGGTGLSLSYSATIDNTNASAYIGGGGGGGAGTGGGGAGGGSGGNYQGYAGGGGGGGVGASGSNGGLYTGYICCYGVIYYGAGGGGGRIFPGVGGARSTTYYGYGGGAGGASGQDWIYNATASGGSGNNPGMNQQGGAAYGPGGGGGWGASGGYGRSPGSGNTASGGSGGKAVALNGNTVTWVSGNTTNVYGSVA